MLRQLLEFLVGSVVDKPDQIRIDHISTPKVELFYLAVAPGDLGRLLGKKGRTVEAIRRVMATIAANQGKETVVDVLE